MSTSSTTNAPECVICLEPVVNPVLISHNPTNTKCIQIFCKFCYDDWEKTCQRTKNFTCTACRVPISGYAKLYFEDEEQSDIRYSQFKPKPLPFEQETSTSPTDEDRLPNARSKCVKALLITAAFALPILALIGSILLMALV